MHTPWPLHPPTHTCAQSEVHIVQHTLCFSVIGRTSVVDAATLTHEHFLQMLSLASLCLGSSLPWHPDAEAWSLCEVWWCLSHWIQQFCNSHPNYSVSSAVWTDRKLNFCEFSVRIHMKKQILQRKTGISVVLLQEWEERVLLLGSWDLGSTHS